MPELKILLDGSGQLEHLADRPCLPIKPQSITLLALPGGMESGRASIAVVAEAAQGPGWVFIENSMQNFIAAAVAFAARYPEEWVEAGVALVVLPPPMASKENIH